MSKFRSRGTLLVSLAWHHHRPFLHSISTILLGFTRKIANHYIRSHVFISLKRVDNGLVLGIIMEYIPQRKYGMFAQV
jgi:hypothetical protein